MRTSLKYLYYSINAVILHVIPLAIALALSSYQSYQVWAQVNVEQKRPQNSEGFHATLDSALTLIRGNVDLSQLGLNGRAEYKRGIHSPFIQASVDYGKKSKETFLNQSFGHARWTAMWWNSVGTEVFAQLQENSFRSLVLRQLYGGGVRVRFSTWRSGQVALGVGSMFEREVYVEGEGDKTREILETNVRATSYLTFRQVIKSEAELTTTVKY